MSGRMFLVLLLGFSSGLPLALTGGTLQAWLTDAKIDLPTIGRFALIGLPYTLKFLWAPIMDEYAPPFLGRRRGWALIWQACLVVSIASMGMMNPGQSLWAFSLIAFSVAFFSATQDIVLDAFRTEILKNEELGAGAGVYVMGYRLAMLVSGALALGLADHMPWKWVYLLMAVTQGLGMIAVWCAPEPKIQFKSASSFKHRVVQPFTEFFLRNGAIEILSFVMVYKLSTMMATSLTTTFLMSLGFTKTEIGAVTKVFGLVATIVGTLSGGAMMTRLGIKRSLWIFGVLQALGGLAFISLAMAGKQPLLMIGVITVENFMIGLGVAAIQGFMMHVCSRQFTGTQFALLSSLAAVPRVILVSEAGTVAQHFGWPGFFLFSVTLALPGLLLLTRYDRWTTHGGQSTKARISVWDSVTIGLFVLGLVAIASEPVWSALSRVAAGSVIVQVGVGAVILALLSGFIKPKDA